MSTVFVNTGIVRGRTAQARIQPLVDRRQEDIQKAYAALLKHRRCVELVGGDLHEGNVGLWKGNPVVIDW